MITILRNVYINKLDDIVKKYNNTYHTSIKMKPVDVKDDTYIDSKKKLIIKVLNSKLVIMWEFQNEKIFFQQDTHQIGLKKSLWLKIKNTVSWTYVFSDLSDNEIIGTFYEKKNTKIKSTRI